MLILRSWNDGANTFFRGGRNDGDLTIQGKDNAGILRSGLYFNADSQVQLYYKGVYKFRTESDGTKTSHAGHAYHRIESTGSNDEHALLEMVAANGKSMRWTNSGTNMTLRDESATIAAFGGSGIDFKNLYLISNYGSSTNVDYLTHDDSTKYGCTGRWKFNSDSPMNKGINDIGNSLLSAGGIEFNNSMYLKGNGNCLDILNDNGYLKIGANNTSYAHFYTDRAKFYFDKELRVKGEIYTGSSYDQKVYHTGNKPTTVDVSSGSWKGKHTDMVRRFGENYEGGEVWFGYKDGKGHVIVDGDFYADTGNSLVWHQGNDGSGSGLDADMLDGLHSSSFVKTSEFGGSSYAEIINKYLRKVSSSGVLEVAKYIDFHTTGSTVDFDMRLDCISADILNVDGGSLSVSGNVTAYSDRRLKSNIQPITSALDKVCKLSGNTFHRDDLDMEQAGVIAQELQAVLPESVLEGDDGMLSVSQAGVVALLVEAVKELRNGTAK